MSLYLAFKEVWRNKARFLLISLVIALITVLVLFIAGLAEGLGSGQKEYIQKLNAELLLYQENVELVIPSSRIGRSKLNDVRRVEGVADAGPIGFASSSIVFEEPDTNSQPIEPVDISLIGVEPGKPGEPPAFVGRGLAGRRANEAIIDENLALQTGLQVGDRFTLRTVQGTLEEFYDLEVVGISDGRRYGINPAAFVPYLTWDRIRPKAVVENEAELTSNVIAVKLQNPAELDKMAEQLVEQVGDVEAADLKTAYESQPGYRPQQSTLNTQRTFTLLIGLLVLGGFFHIQILQKVAQIGVLKAIGTSTFSVIVTAMIQIVFVTILGVLLGSLGTFLLAINFPVSIPLVFTSSTVITAVVGLLIIGPLGGLVSIRTLLRIEPLTALGLAQ